MMCVAKGTGIMLDYLDKAPTYRKKKFFGR
jgi:rod shape-determining protein MreB